VDERGDSLIVRRASPWLCGVVFVFAACRPAAPVGDTPAVVEPPSPQATAIVTMINEQRRQAGVPPLHEAPSLTRAALLHAGQMAIGGRLDHVLPGEAHPRPEDRLAAAGYAWQAWAENLASGRGPSDVVARWMASPEHRANILNPNYTETGVGFVGNGSDPGYYVQLFGRPRS
jgi:uncharacterized protein YkwD